MLDRLDVLLFRLLTSFALFPFLSASDLSTVVLCRCLDRSVPVTLPSSLVHSKNAALCIFLLGQ